MAQENIADYSSKTVATTEADLFAQMFGANAGFVRELYALFLQDASAVGNGWAEFFSGLGEGSVENLKRVINSVNLETKTLSHTNGAHQNGAVHENVVHEKLILAALEFRQRGHLVAKINPLTSTLENIKTWVKDDLDFSAAGLGFSEAELSQVVSFEGLKTLGQGFKERHLSVAEILAELAAIYTGSVGFEYQHLTDRSARNFLQEKIEGFAKTVTSATQKKKIYSMLVSGETLESELHKKFVGQKRFSLQGGESLMPMLDTILHSASGAGVKDAIFGMSHRGRLDVLTAIAGKPLESLFNEFLDNTPASINGDGDVKYHLGSSANYAGVAVTLVPNPSHLEFVNSVVEGISRAKQDTQYAGERTPVLPLLMHGDAAFAGQGCVFETLGFSAVSTYATGGTVHIIINNQVGFTTNATEARSSVYCTDMAKAVEAPIFHVNGDDPEACCFVAQLALEYRMKFSRDVVIDMYCYRKYGHNEGDDPTFTQPLMYKEIQAKKSVMNSYGEALVAQGVFTTAAAAEEIANFKTNFNAAEARATQSSAAVSAKIGEPSPKSAVPAVSTKSLNEVAELLISAPTGFEIHPKLKKILEKRNEALKADAANGIEWGLAEALAFGTLLKEGISIRLSGQDCGRGTFSHRHLLLSDNKTAVHHAVLAPLTNLKTGPRFDIMNSILSETAVMGFEFGYAATAAKTLVIWEAQFGDFANGGQVIIDQFIAASETKWRQQSGITLLLPHGFEGQGPEHSSARLERFLQLCAQNNMMVCYPTSAAQIFHLLRMQAHQQVKRPLVIMSPKSLLRAANAMSSVAELSGQAAAWQPLIMDKAAKQSDAAIIGCAGKVYYDLRGILKETGSLKEAGASGNSNIELLRIEQLYPLPIEDLRKIIGKRRFIWAQEEPENMGAFRYMQSSLLAHGITAHFAGRKAAASPATGSTRFHVLEQKKLVEDAIKLASFEPAT